MKRKGHQTRKRLPRTGTPIVLPSISETAAGRFVSEWLHLPYQCVDGADSISSGLARHIQANDPNNPQWYLGSGTPGYMAPEQCRYINQETQEPIYDGPLSQKTNVWAIGAVLASMIWPKNSFNQPIWLGQGMECQTLYSLRIANQPPYNSYSAELRDIVNRCLSYDPIDRPTARELQYEVLQQTDRPGSGKDGRLHPDSQMEFCGDEYQLGLAKNRLPRRMDPVDQDSLRHPGENE